MAGGSKSADLIPGDAVRTQFGVTHARVCPECHVTEGSLLVLRHNGDP